jgi:hypothetical protein
MHTDLSTHRGGDLRDMRRAASIRRLISSPCCGLSRSFAFAECGHTGISNDDSASLITDCVLLDRLCCGHTQPEQDGSRAGLGVVSENREKGEGGRRRKRKRKEKRPRARAREHQHYCFDVAARPCSLQSPNRTERNLGTYGAMEYVETVPIHVRFPQTAVVPAG